MTYLPSLLVAASAFVILCLGVVHLALTWRGRALHPRDEALTKAMRAVSPVISRETTMWQAWVGFNASHAFGAILFGLVYGYLAVAAPGLLFGSLFLQAVGALLLAGYVVLAHRYWFSAPLRGTVLATLLYAAGLALCAWGLCADAAPVIPPAVAR